MRIDSQIPAGDNLGTNRVNDSKSGAAQTSSTPVANEPNDTVQLSSAQGTVRRLVSQLTEVPDLRQNQVSSLRSQIQSGQYRPNSVQVAGAVVTQLLGVNANR